MLCANVQVRREFVITRWVNAGNISLDFPLMVTFRILLKLIINFLTVLAKESSIFVFYWLQ